MFGVRPNMQQQLGFHVATPIEEVPGLHAWRSAEDLPGFRMNMNGSMRDAHIPQPFSDAGNPFDPSSQLGLTATFTPVGNGSLRQPPRENVNIKTPYPTGSSTYPDASIWEKIRDSDWLIPRVEAAMDGAISIVPGTWNAARAVGRAAGAAGKEEAKRFDREMEFIGKALGLAADHPDITARVAVEMASELFEDPLLPYHVGGRVLAGSVLRAGPIPLGVIATIGDTLRAVEKGYRFPDAVRQGSVGTSWLRRLGR